MHGKYAFNPKPIVAHREAQWDGRKINDQELNYLWSTSVIS